MARQRAVCTPPPEPAAAATAPAGAGGGEADAPEWRAAAAAAAGLAAAAAAGQSAGTWQLLSAGGAAAAAPPSAVWLPAAACVLCGLIALRCVLFPACLVPLARRLGAPDDAKARKTAQQLLNLCHHTTCTAAAALLLPSEAWWYTRDPGTMWGGWVEGQHAHSVAVHALYMQQLGYHAHCLLFHFAEPKRDDFVQMLVHHAVTAYLIWQSYASNFVHVGLLVLFAHDASDVIGCSIKITNYLNYKHVTVCLFPVLLWIWAHTRLYLFPRHCIVSSWRYSAGFETSTGYTICFVLMFVILGLNAWWYSLFLRILVNLVKSPISSNPNTTDLSEEGRISPQKSVSGKAAGSEDEGAKSPLTTAGTH